MPTTLVEQIDDLLKLVKTADMAKGSSFFVPASANLESTLNYLIEHKEESITTANMLRATASEACLQMHLLGCNLPVLLPFTNSIEYVEPRAIAIALDSLRYQSDVMPLSEQDVTLLKNKLEAVVAQKNDHSILSNKSGVNSWSPFVSVDIPTKEIEAVGFHKLLYLCNTGSEFVGVYERVETVDGAQFTSRYRTVLGITQPALREFEIELFKGERNNPERKIQLSFVNTDAGWVWKALQQNCDVKLIFDSNGFPSLVSCASNYVISGRTLKEIDKQILYNHILSIGGICSMQENSSQSSLVQILDYSLSLQTIVSAALNNDPEKIKNALEQGFIFTYVE